MKTELANGAAEMLRLKQQYLVPCVYHFYREPPVLCGGDDAYVFDTQGRRYLDCFTGVTVTSAGHCNPEIIEPAIEQIRRLGHTTSIYLTEPVLRLAEALAEIAPGDLKRSFFTASGTEAVEGALLTAALHTKRRRVLAFDNGLHGRTRWAMNVTGAPMWRTDPFPQDDIVHVPFGDADAVEAALAGGSFAAVIGEPIQGNGGVNVPPRHFWPRVRDGCNRTGTMLVLDEIQTGLGRTGRPWACEHWDVAPDVLCTSKALGNGFPIAAFITTDAIADSYTRPGASTYGGNPVSATAALATLRYHADHDLANAASSTGRALRESLAKLTGAILDEPRGLGLMIGCPVASTELCDELLERLKTHGVLAGKTGPGRDVLTLLPPLTFTPEQCDELLEALQVSLDEVEAFCLTRVADDGDGQRLRDERADGGAA